MIEHRYLNASVLFKLIFLLEIFKGYLHIKFVLYYLLNFKESLSRIWKVDQERSFVPCRQIYFSGFLSTLFQQFTLFPYQK